MAYMSGSIGGLAPRTARRLATVQRLRMAAARAQLSNPEDRPAMAAPPSVTISGSADSALTRQYDFASTPGVFMVANGIPAADTVNANNYVFPLTKLGNGSVAGGNIGPFTADGEDNQSAWTVSVMTDADVIEYRLRRNVGAGRKYRFIVDGEFVDRDGHDPQGHSAGGASSIRLAFADRRMRIITVEGHGDNSHGFYRVNVGPTSYVAYPDGLADLTALFAGDSFTEGENVAAKFAWPVLASRRLGIGRCFNLGIGSTGYVATGSGNRRDQADQINDVQRGWTRPGVPWANAELVVFAPMYNDKAGVAGSSALRATLQSRAVAAWQAARNHFPDALIAVLEGFGGRYGTSADTLAAGQALGEAFESWKDSFALFLPVNQDAGMNDFQPWQTGNGYIGAETGEGNSDLTTSADGIHPGVYGHDVISRRFVRAFVKELAKL